MLNDFILFLTKGSEKVTYLYVSGVTGDEWYQLCDLLSKAPVSSPTGARWERTQPKPCCRAHRASPPILNLRRVWVLLRSPLQGQRGRGFVRNQTRCHQKAQFQSAICQAIFGYVKPFFPQDSCLWARSKRTFQGVNLQSHVLSSALFSNYTGRFRKKLYFFSHFCKRFIQGEKKKPPSAGSAFPQRSSSLLAPWSLSEVSLLHWLAKQLVLIHLSPC